MICITGDTHGEAERFVRIGKACGLGEGDMLIVAGDFGCVFGLGQRDEEKLNLLESLPYTILFVDGNHECFPKIYSYPMETLYGGKVHRIRSNVLHLMRGQVFEMEGRKIFTMGGGYSMDVMLRRPGVSWWPEEMPSDEEYREAWANLEKHGNRVDVIISHALPSETIGWFIQQGRISNGLPQEMKLNYFLEEVRQRVTHSHYYFGHIHIDEELWRNQTALYYGVYNLKTGQKMNLLLK